VGGLADLRCWWSDVGGLSWLLWTTASLLALALSALNVQLDVLYYIGLYSVTLGPRLNISSGSLSFETMAGC